MDNVIFVLILIVLLIKCDASDLNATGNPHIIFTGLSSSNPQQALNYTVVANKPLHLHFQNITHGWCYIHSDHEEKLDKGERGLPKMKNSTYSFRNVTHNMSTQWKCKVKFENNNGDCNKKINYYYLNLHVKGAKSVKITVNGKELTFGEADLSVPYDGDTTYFYEDDEHVQIVCRNPHRTGSVHVEYFTKDATNISDSGTFFIQLHSGSNSSYIDCVYNSTKPVDTYIYRVIFVTKKQLFYLNENSSESLSPILGSSIGAVLIILGLTAAACWYVRTRNAKHIKTPYEDFSNHNDSSTPQGTNECENQYDTCHYSENLPNRETYYETPGCVENNIDPEDHYYTKVDYLSCKLKIGETQTRDSKVYDEPYVQITERNGMHALQQH